MNRIVEHYLGLVDAARHFGVRVKDRTGRPSQVAITLHTGTTLHGFGLHKHEVAVLLSKFPWSVPIPDEVTRRYHRTPGSILKSLKERMFIKPVTNLEQPKGLYKQTFFLWDRWWDAVAANGEWKLTTLGAIIAKALMDHQNSNDEWASTLPWYDLDDAKMDLGYEGYARIFHGLMELGFDVEVLRPTDGVRGTRISVRPSKNNYWLRDRLRAEDHIGWVTLKAMHPEQFGHMGYHPGCRLKAAE